TADDSGHAVEIRARDFVQLEWEFIMLQARESLREVVDGIVRHRQRAMAAGIRHLEFEILIEFFARLDCYQRFPIVYQLERACVGIENVLGFYEIAMILN